MKLPIPPLHGDLDTTLIVLSAETFAKYLDHPIVRRLYLTSAGFFPHAAHHYCVRPEGRDEHILLYCVAGSGVVEVNECLYSLHQNEVFCVPCGHPHRYWATEKDPWSLLWLHCKGEDCALYPLEDCQIRHLDSEDTIRQLEYLFARLFRTLREDYSVGNFVYLTQLLSLLLGEIYDHMPSQTAYTRQELLVQRGVRIMRQHLNENLSMDSLCELLGVSKSPLYSAFHTCLGYPPLAFYNRLKMQSACERLRSGQGYIYEVAQSLGFSDPYYFSRLFKKIVGVSPQTYLQQEDRLPNNDVGLPRYHSHTIIECTE